MADYAPGEINPTVELVAKTLYEAFYSSPWPPEPFDSELRSPDDWRSAARAAILKLREPTEAMLASGESAAMYGCKSFRDEVKDAWQAMIDEAAR